MILFFNVQAFENYSSLQHSVLLIIKICERTEWKTKVIVKRTQNNPAQLEKTQYDMLLMLGNFQFS